MTELQLPPEAAAFISKAAENLTDAQVALGASRYNACANRCYYAAFQAAVAALWVEGIRPTAGQEGTLSHRMVQAEWARRLVYRRKLYPPELRDTLRDLMQLRVTADYRVDHVTARRARAAAAESERLIRHVEARLLPQKAEKDTDDGTSN